MRNRTTSPSSKKYQKIKTIDGRHSLQKLLPEEVVLYRARKRKGGKVAYFNFSLAREMGLVGPRHDDHMTDALEEVLLDTFGIVIINEFDIEAKKKFPKEDIKPHHYMATRYLQLQHPNKQGKTSGDGRSVWNGEFISNKGIRWDISSCGTGATSLSPATHIHKKYFETGDPSISYGCGYAEYDEGLSSLFFSEVLKKNGHPSESILGIIEYENGLSINIRAHKNLLRPSHFFRTLKLGKRHELAAMIDYYIERQVGNGEWPKAPKTKKARCHYFLKEVTKSFAKMTANFEDDYIFCWLDWDGDNILMDGGIIDYGSVRQFGLFHHEYRYDDVQRYSTTITEQKSKARYIVQTFAQACHFVLEGEKRPIKEFSSHSCVTEFELVYSEQKDENLLYKMGLCPEVIGHLVAKNLSHVRGLRKAFSYFERAKSSQGPIEVADGITCNAVYCMRDILRELPMLLSEESHRILDHDFLEILCSSYAGEEESKLTPNRKKRIRDFQKSYWELVVLASKKMKHSIGDELLSMSMRSSVINKYDRVTGDAITCIVGKVMNHRPKLGPDEIFTLAKDFSESQNLGPEKKTWERPKNKQRALYKRILSIVKDYREGL